MAWWNRTASPPPLDEEEFRLERLERRVDLLAGDNLAILHLSRRILAMSQAVLDKIAQLQSAVESERSVEQSAITLLLGLSAQIKDLTNRVITDPTDAEALAQLSALSDSIASNTGDLAAAVSANTPTAQPSAPAAPAAPVAQSFQNTPAESGVTTGDSGHPQSATDEGPAASAPAPAPDLAPVPGPAPDLVDAGNPAPVEPIPEPVEAAPVEQPSSPVDLGSAPQPDVVEQPATKTADQVQDESSDQSQEPATDPSSAPQA